jgi:hypothetical protein
VTAVAGWAPRFIDQGPASRVFDVTISRDPCGEGFVFSIVANSFEQASAAAVDKANRLLDLRAKAIEEGAIADWGERKAVERFSPRDVIKMESVRGDVAIFRHAEVAR